MGVAVVSPPGLVREWNIDEDLRGGDNANMAATAGMGALFVGEKGWNGLIEECDDNDDDDGCCCCTTGLLTGLRISATRDILELLDIEEVDSRNGTASCSTRPWSSCS